MWKKLFNSAVPAFQIYQLVRYAALMLIAILFTKTSLTQIEIGEYETFLFVSGAVCYFWLTGLLKAMLPLSAGDAASENQSPLVFTIFVIIQIFSLLAAALLFLFTNFISDLLLNGNAVPFPLLIAVFIVLGTPANLVEYLYLLRKQNQHIVLYGAMSFILQILLTLIPVAAGYGIGGAITGLIVSYIIRYAWLWVVLIKNFRISFSLSSGIEFLKFGWPLVIATLLGGSAQYVDGFIVTSRFNEQTFAVFRYGARELPLAVLMANALSNSMLSDFSSRDSMILNLPKLLNNTRLLMHFLFPVSAILLILAHPVFPVLFNPAFANSATIFNVYILLIISRLLFPQTLLTGMRYTNMILIASGIELFINVALSLIFVKYWGIAGVAAATVVAYLSEKLLLVKMVKNKLGVNSDSYIPWQLFGIYSMGLIIVFIFVEFIVY